MFNFLLFFSYHSFLHLLQPVFSTHFQIFLLIQICLKHQIDQYKFCIIILLLINQNKNGTLENGQSLKFKQIFFQLKAMHQEDQGNSFCASFSDFCSLGERIQGNREQTLFKENSRLRHQHSEISQKYMKMCEELSKMQAKLIEKEKKITQLDLFYNREIQTLKKQLSSKNKQLIKLSKLKDKKKVDFNKENQGENGRNSQDLEECLQNQSLVLGEIQNQNVKLHQLLNQALLLFQPALKSKQFSEIKKRMNHIKKQLSDKINMTAVLSKSNQLLEESRIKGQQYNDGQMLHLMNILKSKSSQLRKTPVTLDYDLQVETKNLDVIFTDLDIQLRLLKLKKDSEE